MYQQLYLNFLNGITDLLSGIQACDDYMAGLLVRLFVLPGFFKLYPCDLKNRGDSIDIPPIFQKVLNVKITMNRNDIVNTIPFRSSGSTYFNRIILRTFVYSLAVSL